MFAKTVTAIMCLALLVAGCKKSAPPGNYDLANTSITFSPNPVKVGDKVVFTYTVINLGTSDVPEKTYDIEFWIDGKKVSYDYASPISLAAGNRPITHSMAPGFFHFEAKQAGTYKYKLLLDPRDRVNETDEGNNVIEGTFAVTK